MANILKVSMQHSIILLHEKGWSNRRISRELGVNRRTVTKYVKDHNSKCTISTIGSSKDHVVECMVSKCTISTAGDLGRQSKCLPFKKSIEDKLEIGLSATRIHQDLVCENDFTGSYESVKRYIRRLTDVKPLPFRRLEVKPGWEAQVDYGTGARILTEDGKRRKTHLFRIVLSNSRKGYSEVTYTQSSESFIRALENAFHHFGGVPEVIVPDNLKAAVKKPDLYDPEINPKLLSFAEHYGCAILPTKVRTPRHKGKVEKSVDYVQENALKGRMFRSIKEQNIFLRKWELNVADTRIHGTLRKQVRTLFEQEKPFLKPLPDSLFPMFKESRRKVHRDGHIEVERAFYSVPAEYSRSEVWARYDNRTVRIFNGKWEQIALHATKEPGMTSTNDSHIPDEKRHGIEKGEEWLLTKAHNIGPNTGAWAKALLLNRGIYGIRPLHGLINLSRKYHYKQIESGCKKALNHELFRLKNVRKLIENEGAPQQQTFEFLSTHPLIRGVNEYEQQLNTKELFYEQYTHSEA